MDSQEFLLTSVPLNTLVNKLRISLREDLAELLGNTSSATGGATEQNLLTREQLAEKLNVSPNSIAIWDKKGKIPAVRIGTSVRYDYQQVLAALSKKKAK